MKKSFSLATAVLVSVFVAAGCTSSKDEKQLLRNITKTAYVKKISKPIKIDGIGSDKAWEKADKMSGFFLQPYPFYKDRIYSTHETTARFLYDDKNLYFLLEMEDADIWCTMTNRDDRLCREDVIELFFKPKGHEIFEFEFSPTGVVFDLMWPRRTARSTEAAQKYNANVKLKSKVHGTLDNYQDTDTKWVVEGAIPFKDFAPAVKGTPKPGDIWDANICRYDYSVDLPDRELSTWNPHKSLEYGFAQFEDYGKLIFK